MTHDLQTSTVEPSRQEAPVDGRPAGLPATRPAVPRRAGRNLLARLELEQAIGWTGVSEPDPIDQLPAWRRADAYNQTFSLWKTVRDRRHAA